MIIVIYLIFFLYNFLPLFSLSFYNDSTNKIYDTLTKRSLVGDLNIICYILLDNRSYVRRYKFLIKFYPLTCYLVVYNYHISWDQR